MSFNRKNDRPHSGLREINYKLDPFGYSDGSIFYEQGNTKVYVSVSLQNGVPRFLKGSGQGWLTAEYAMHPHSSDQGRMQRESSSVQKNNRGVEISRLIGRCFRSVVDLSGIGEKTVYIDCDVLQADGGTRTACITAASIALANAQKSWRSKGLVRKPVIKNKIAGISVGLVDGFAFLDLDQAEDNRCDSDFNFIVTDNNMIVEVQGTAEKYPLAWTHFDDLRDMASKGIQKIFEKVEI